MCKYVTLYIYLKRYFYRVTINTLKEAIKNGIGILDSETRGSNRVRFIIIVKQKCGILKHLLIEYNKVFLMKIIGIQIF